MNYARKNKDRITFHKILAFAKSPAAYKAIYEDFRGQDLEDKDCFIIGRAVEDYIYGKEKDYEVVSRRSDGAAKIQLTRAQGKLVSAASSELAKKNPFGEVKGKKEVIEVLYKGETLGGEIDELMIGDFKVKGVTFDGYICDIKTAASFSSFENFKQQYLGQISFYQYLAAVKHEIDPIRLAGIIKLVTKEAIPKSKVFLITPARLVEHWAQWKHDLEELIEMKQRGEWPELSWQDCLEFDEIYHLVPQPDYVLL